MIKTYASYNQVKETHELAGHLTIVVDVLRATSTMLTALKNGASYIYPVESVSDAMKLKQYHTQAVLGGERDLNKIEGFHYSNSPYDYPMHHIYNKQLIFTTTNGTRAMQKCNDAAQCTIAAMLNAGAIINLCKNTSLPISIVMAGTEGMFALEDALCAGAIIYGLNKLQKADDLGNVCADIFYKHLDKKDFYSAMMQGNHARYLAENGFRDDIKFCSQYNIYDIAPTYKEGVLTL
ncbi:MAG: 2-phosphosulfolactate phosphatase [Clostridia bacterium]|nr:2-phosphosulfolactate phosphatase [Clostridia bacterium]